MAFRADDQFAAPGVLAEDKSFALEVFLDPLDGECEAVIHSCAELRIIDRHGPRAAAVGGRKASEVG